MATSGKVVALTGADGFLGKRLLLRLEDDPEVARVRVLDVRCPDLDLKKTEFHRIDLTRPTSDQEMAAALLGADALVHLAFLQRPVHNTAWAHELESAGTMLVLNACAEAGTPRLVVGSTTLVYGPSATNPNFLTEDHPFPAHASCAFLDDKVEAERQVRRFREKHPRVRVTVLRMAPIVGPTVRNMVTGYLDRRVAPVAMGFDPLLQFLHEDDAVDALRLALDSEASGEFNIVGGGVIPLSQALRAAGCVRAPVPHRVARSVASALWTAQISRTPAGLTDHLRHLCVADGGRAQRMLGFTARHSTASAVHAFAGTRRLRQVRVA